MRSPDGAPRCLAGTTTVPHGASTGEACGPGGRRSTHRRRGSPPRRPPRSRGGGRRRRPEAVVSSEGPLMILTIDDLTIWRLVNLLINLQIAKSPSHQIFIVS